MDEVNTAAEALTTLEVDSEYQLDSAIVETSAVEPPVTTAVVSNTNVSVEGMHTIVIETNE